MKPREIIWRFIRAIALLFSFFICVFVTLKCSIDMQVVIGISVFICIVAVFTMIEGIISIGRDIGRNVEKIKKELMRRKL